MNGLTTGYWMCSSLFMLFPVIVVSVLVPRKNHYLLRMLLGVGVYLTAAYIFSARLQHSHSAEMIPLNVLSLGIFFLCNAVSIKNAIHLKMLCLAIECLGQQGACLLASILCADQFYENLLFMKIAIHLLNLTWFVFLIKKLLEMHLMEMPRLNVCVSVMVAVIGIGFNSISFEHFQERSSSVFLYQTFCMLCVLLTLYLQVQNYNRQLVRNEAELFQQLWMEQQKQYETKKEYIERINYKYHNLKHEILAANSNGEHEKINNTVKKYEYISQTGNPVLDTILNEKFELFEKYQITVNCMIDSDLDLNFINTTDLYIVLGNALDNVIDNLKTADTLENKYASIRMFNDKAFLRIIIKNNYAGSVCYNGTLPVTRKRQEGHGYGLKSIQHIMKKYNGGMSITTENQEFTLRLLFPRQSLSENAE